jgi:hypothetical protein
LQVGLDQEPALILSNVGPGAERVLELLDGCHHLREIRSCAQRSGVTASLLDWLLRTLQEANLLSEGGDPLPGSVQASRVRLIGAGVLGKAVAEPLVNSGIATLYVIDNDPPDPSLYRSTGALGTQAEALQAHLGQTGKARVSVAGHWSKPEEVTPDLTIVATDLLESDRVVVDGLLRADQAHLLIRARAGGAVVGPLVIPGQTPCLRCTDLVRRDLDPAWPTLLAQLMRTRMPTAPALAQWAGGIGAAQALGLLHGGTPETWGATLEISPTDFVTRRRVWSMHPGCGCGWSLTAQWGA